MEWLINLKIIPTPIIWEAMNNSLLIHIPWLWQRMYSSFIFDIFCILNIFIKKFSLPIILKCVLNYYWYTRLYFYVVYKVLKLICNKQPSNSTATPLTIRLAVGSIKLLLTIATLLTNWLTVGFVTFLIVQLLTVGSVSFLIVQLFHWPSDFR